MKHDLKIEPPYYQAILDGKKTFEVRYNDRGFNAGDIVILQPLCENRTYDILRPKLIAEIGYVTGFGMQDGYVVFSLINVQEL